MGTWGIIRIGMAYRHHKLSALIEVEPARARAAILKSFHRLGSLQATADELGCSRATLYRWMRRLGLVSEMKVRAA